MHTGAVLKSNQKMSDNQASLTSGHRLARNVLWNLLGTGAPLLVALVAIPLLIDGLGTERFGVLMLSWMVVGYFSLFDLGLGRAVTKLVAEKLGQGVTDEIPSLVWTAILLMAVLGVLGACIVAVLSPWLVDDALNIPLELQAETLTAFYILAASIPVIISMTGLRGVLEAHQRFDLVNVVRMPLGMVTFLGPVVVLPFSNSLVPVITVLVVARLFSWCAYAVLCLKVEATLHRSVSVHRAMVKPLVSFGGWLTVSNLISPLMVYMDRFLIGAMLTMTAVTYYATPYEVVTKLLVVPVALMGVLFPAFTTALAQDKAHAARLYVRSVIYIFLLLFPAVLIIVTFAREGLTFWLGVEFSGDSSLVLQILAVGVLVNCLAHVPAGLIQGAGRPDITAKLHMAELPFYLLILWWLLSDYGIVGVAIAWVSRVVLDALLLFIMAQKLLPSKPQLLFRTAWVVSLSVLMLVLGAVIPVFAVKSGVFLVMLFAFVMVAWFILLTSDEKNMIRSSLPVLK